MTDDKELAPVNVEIVLEEDLKKISVLAKMEKTDSGIDLLGKADAVLGLASDVLGAAGKANLYKVEIPNGYSLKDLVPSKKDVESVRAIVKDSEGKINGDVSLKLNGVSPTQIASLGLAAAAMVVGQAYMTEISNSLNSIDSKLDVVASMLADEQKAKVKYAIEVAGEYIRLHDDYRSKPREAFQAARSEIESRYNDVGEVANWVTERLSDLEVRITNAKPLEKEIAPLLEELHSYENQFDLCLQALSALAMTRMILILPQIG